MTLEQQIIREALPGFSIKRELPGGFVAYIAKPIDDRQARVEYVHCNTDQRIHRLVHNQVRAMVLA